MKNLVNKFRNLVGIEKPEDKRSAFKKVNLDYRRKHYSPTYKMKDKQVSPVLRREYQKDNGMVEVEEKPFEPKRKLKGIAPLHARR